MKSRHKTSHAFDVAIVSQFFYPHEGATSQLITDVYTHFSSEGIRTAVLTSTPHNSTNTETHIIRLTSPCKTTITLAGKISSSLRFLSKVLVWQIANRDKLSNAHVLYVSNPPYIVFVAFLLNQLLGTKYSFLFQDLFPSSAVLAGLLPERGFFTNLIRYFIRISCSHAESVIVLSQDMAQRFQAEFSSKVRVVTIHNWAVQDLSTTPSLANPYKKLWNKEEDFIILYSGNFGKLHDIITILETARLLKGHKFKFIFVGHGAKSNQIRLYKEKFGLANVLILEPQPRSQLHHLLASCHLSVVSLIPGAEEIVAPSKIYGVLAAARPVILISNPKLHLQDLMKEYHCGISVSSGESVELATRLLNLYQDRDELKRMNHNSLALYEKEYGRSKSLRHYQCILHKTNADTTLETP